MSETYAVSDIANAIQLSVAPVFLLAGVGALLNVLANRLTRAVDRIRLLTADPELQSLAGAKDEVRIQLSRTELIHWSIILCTLCALAICLVVALLFVGNGFLADPSLAIAVLFIGGMVSLTVGLILFLREIGLALRLMRNFSGLSEN